ncbi:hypothetical protein FALBO_7913 [Fusarium albosuccineum]|uniref:NACHT domain-containing protein n=1 Tax=Fusarium albosuccineum TaxID=1237068 RepID=A0A8H4PDB0_9HYPO|nr:hypothetical protein FALBO_7913 [Fusarium albosuccineum]
MEKPPDLWATARKSLPESVREWLSKVESSQDPSSLTSEQQIERLIHQTKNKQAELEAKRSNLTIKFGSLKLELKRYFGTIVKWLDKFKGIGDVAVAFDPIDAALPWAAFQLVLQINSFWQAVVAEQEHSDAIVKLLAATSQFLFTGRVFEAVYNRKSMQMGEKLDQQEIGQQCLDSLHEELIQLYLRIITALGFCYSILCENKARRKLIAVFKSSEPAEILSELQIRHKQAIERGDACGKISNHQISSTSLALIRELQPCIENLKDQVSRMLVQMDKREWVHTLQAISDIPFQAHHDEIHCRRTPGTCEWILEQPKFVQWLNEESPVTVLYGDPGAGKTYLISKVIGYAIDNAEEGEAVAFIYCKRDEESRRTPQDILRSIEQLVKAPSGLEESYDLIWNNIELMSDYEITFAKRALLWLICASRPLDMNDLSSAMLIDPSTDEADDFGRLPNEEDILGICGNLVTYDKRLGMWRFCHLSAREYVEKHIDTVEANCFIAMSCFKILTTNLHESAEPDFGITRRKSQGDLQEAVGQSRYEPLKGVRSFVNGYIIKFALDHAGRADRVALAGSSRLKALLRRFLGSVHCTSRAYKDWLHIDHGESLSQRTQYLKQNETSPLPAMSVFGLFHLLREWWDEAIGEFDFHSLAGPSLLYLAIWNDQEDIWRFMIHKRIYLDHPIGLPLIAAIEKHRPNVFEALLEAGARVNEVQLSRIWHTHRLIDTPLKAALFYRSFRSGGYPYVRKLLQNGAKVHLSTAKGDTLWIAAKFGCDENIREFLGTESRVVSNGFLVRAVEQGKSDFLALALEKNADLNCRYARGSPLMGAVRRGYWVSVKALLELGAHVNMVSNFGPGTALTASFCLFSGWIFHSLLDAGADINLNNGRENPLTWILKAPQLGVEGDIRRRARKILWAGIDVNQVLVDASFPTALSFATAHNDLAVVEVLLSTGADPSMNVQYGFGSALASAAFHGRLENCEVLLDQPSVDVNGAQEGYFGNVLFALMDGHRWYLDSRVDHKRRHGWLRSDWSRCHEFMGTLHETEHLRVLDLFFWKGLSIYSSIYIDLGFPPTSRIELGANKLVAAWILF